MEPISTALAGIALFKSAVDGIKGAISTAQDVGDIAGYIDNLFEGESQVQKSRNKKAGVDQFNVKSVAQETIDARLAQEKMYEMSQMIDLRFGHGTWAGIVSERARRIQEAKEVAKKARIEKARQQHELFETIKTVAIIVGVALIAAGSLVAIVLTSS